MLSELLEEYLRMILILNEKKQHLLRERSWQLAVNISEPRENLLFHCVVDPSPKDSERGDLF